jgi:two-component system LytT family response regulator
MRALLVDDDPAVRRDLRLLLGAHRDVEVVGECSTGTEAVEAVARHEPELVILEVCLPELDGLGVVRRIGDDPLPLIVFATAHGESAVQAFDVGAIDFLVKPLDEERLGRMLDRAREEVRARTCVGRSHGNNGSRRYRERFALRSEGRIVFLRTRDVQWIEAAGNYVRLHVGDDKHLLRATMAATESCLDPEWFLRIHRSIIVNLEYVAEVKPWFHGEFAVFLSDGTRLNLSRSYRRRLDAFLGLS